MSVVPAIIETRLETAIDNNSSIKEVLDAKVEYYKNNNLPVEESIADYIALGIENQKEKIAQYKEYKKELTAAIKALEELEEKTSNEVANWMSENGLEKLKGIHCSSVTFKDKKTSITEKFVLDASRDELIEKGLAHKEDVIKEILSGVKINKRRGQCDTRKQLAK